jgi:hypothetical protein
MKGRGALALAESAHPDHLRMAPTELDAPRPRGHGGWTSGPPGHLRVRQWSQTSRLCLGGVRERTATLLVVAHP